MKHRFLLAFILFLIPMWVNAGVLSNLDDLFLSNSTASTRISTKDRSGVFAGSFYMRAPSQSINLIAFDPPRVDAGCGGIDLYGGSFTFINSQQLIQIFREVAANASGLAFKAAISAISPSLDKLITEFQTLMQNLNNLSKNSCQLAGMIVDHTSKVLNNAVNGDGSVGGVNQGFFSDQIGGLTSYLANANQYFAKNGEINPKSGNQAVKAAIASGSAGIMGLPGIPNVDGSTDNSSDPNSLNNRLIISLLGYNIAGVPCSKSSQNGTPDNTTQPANSTIGQVTCSGPSTITLDDLVKGGGPSSTRPGTPLNLYTCVNPTGSGTPNGGFDPQICTQMKLDNFSYEGIAGWVNSSLFGTPDPSAQPTTTSILGKLNSGSSVDVSGTSIAATALTATQIQFMQQSGIPFIPLLTKTSNPAMRIAIAQQLVPYITDCVAATVGEVLYKGANGIQNATGYELTHDQKRAIELLRQGYMNRQNLCTHSDRFEKVLQTLNAATKVRAGSNR